MKRGGNRRFAYRLAAKLGFVDVDAMLRRIPWRKFLEWQAFETLEPFGEERADWNAAHIVQLLARTGKPLKEFMLPFGDSYVDPPAPQSIEYQEKMIDSWVFVNNAVIAAKEERRNR